MDSPTPIPVRVRSHGRQVSSDERRRMPMTRRSTKGPLDVDDMPEPPSTQAVPAELAPPIPALETSLPPSPGPASGSTLLSPDVMSPASSIKRSASPSGHVDLSFLLRPMLYHPVPTSQIPPQFINSEHQPSPQTPIQTLISQGQFRHAATRAVSGLTSGSISNYDHETILHLYHIRLSCLSLISLPQQAALEARPLIDWLARNTSTIRSPQGLIPEAQLIPWPLRILLHRLQTLASGDQRRAVMTLYVLATEARSSHNLALGVNDATTAELWSSRLSDLGILVANSLISMNELETAARHLDSLPADPITTVHKCLLWLRIGDVAAVERSIAALATNDKPLEKEILQGLLSISRNDYENAVTILTTLHASHPTNEMVTQNLAVCLLYTGHMAQGCELLETIVNQGETFSALLFNLATMYELRTEKAAERKAALVQSVVEMGPQGERGWERGLVDFKL